jgi:hypothetical protein
MNRGNLAVALVPTKTPWKLREMRVKEVFGFIP